MTEQPAKPHEVDSSANENSADGNKPRKTWQDPSLFSENEVQVSYISGSFLGIAIAGGAYAVCLGGITILFDQIVSSTGIGSFFEIALSMLFFSLIASPVGMLLGALSGLLSIPIVIFMNRSLGNPLDARSAAISAGSLAGYMPTAWVLFIPKAGWLTSVSAGLFGPILAMLLGAYGAAWASGKFGGFDFNVATKRSKRRLSIFNMMMATAWVAVTFAIANLFGGLGFAIAAAGWFVLQGFLLGVIHLYRKLRKQGANQRSIS